MTFLLYFYILNSIGFGISEGARPFGEGAYMKAFLSVFWGFLWPAVYIGYVIDEVKHGRH